MGGRGGKGTRVSEFLFSKNPNLKKKYFRGEGEGGAGVVWDGG